MLLIDVVIVLAVAALVACAARQETGQAFLNAGATLLAAMGSAAWAPALTQLMRWEPVPGTQSSPVAAGLLFAVLWAAGLYVSARLHQDRRWNMHPFDSMISPVFGLVTAVTVGHIFAGVIGGVAMVTAGELPQELRDSLVTEEFRSFRSYHAFVEAFHRLQNGG